MVGLLTMLLAIPLAAQSPRRAGQPTDGPSITWVNTQPSNVTLPAGVTHQTFQSQVVGQPVGYCLYLPPDYESHPDRRYPVIYNLHGNGGNEFHSFEDVQVLHDGIVAGRWPPLIVVLPNGGRSTMYKDSWDGKFPVESMLIRELIPHIDAKYRTIARREGRCIEGFSMGGRGAMRLAVKYPELFSSVFCQAGNVPRTSEHFDPATPDVFPNNYLGPDRVNYENNDAFVLAERNRARIQKLLRIQIACGTRDDGHLPTIRDFHQHLVQLGIDHTYVELEGLGHNRKEMLARLAPVWFDYHVESLRRAGGLPPAER
jgi:endo-1,4-beta-xylanase